MTDDEPSLHIAGFRLWIDRYERPDSNDEYDGNWLIGQLECIGNHAAVRLIPFSILVQDLIRWLDDCTRLSTNQITAAKLEPLEPYLTVTIDHSGEFNGLLATFKITPDLLTQFHEFRFPIDQSDLARLIESLRILLARFPLRGNPRR